MAEPFSVGAGIVGVLGLAIQISQMVLKFGLDWKEAPKETKLICNPSFEEAFDGNSSALLSHLKANDLSQDSIKEAFETCQTQLVEVVDSFKAKERSHRLGWERFKAPFSSFKTSKAISELQRQCQSINQLILIDTATIVASTRLEVKEVRKEHQQWHAAERNRKILRWLSHLSFEEKHRDILSKLHPGTGQWLLDSDQFKAWRNGHQDSPPNLWCPGIPGAGKTVLAANVVDHLQQLFAQDNVAVLYIYCDYKDQVNQTDRNLFASLAKQSISQRSDLPFEAKALYSDCQEGNTSPSSEQCLNLLKSSIDHYRRTFIVLDALDEHLPSDEDNYSPENSLLSELKDIQQQKLGRCSFFMTSREIHSIQEQLQDWTRLDIRAKESDIRSFVKSRICDDKKFTFAGEVRADPGLAKEIIENVVEKAQGMFLLPRLHLDRLGNQTRIGKVRKALNDLPSKLDDTYEDAMYRIQHQHEEHRQLAMRALSWISKAERPLQVEELQHAIAVEFGDEDVEDGPLESATLILSVCAGLVTIDAESRTFRLVHFSVQEFFEKKHYKWFPDADRVIAETCLTYLSFDAFEQTVYQGSDSLLLLLRQYPLFSYAAENWGRHVNRSGLGLEEVKDVALRFLGNERKVAAAMQAMWQKGDYSLILFRYADQERVPGIYLVLAVQCFEFAAAWKSCGGKIDTKDPTDGYTALQLSIKLYDLEMTRCLLDAGADVNESRNDGCTALMDAADRALCEIVKLLLERGADPNVKDKSQFSCLHHAVSSSGWIDFPFEACCGCVELLLKAGADIEARDASGNTPLMSALFASNFSIGEYLLQQGASVDVANSGGEPPLFYILKHCYRVQPMITIRMIELLLQSGADVDAADSHGITALRLAAVDLRRYAETEFLVQSGANVNFTDIKRRTVLMDTAEICNDEKIIHLLLRSGADVNMADHLGCTALMESVRNPTCSCKGTELLLQFGADVNATDEFGETAVTKVVRECFCFSNASRTLRERRRDVLGALLSRGVSEQNRKNALDLALSDPDIDEEIVKMLLPAEESAGACEEMVSIRQHA
ncbi:hypothetical protein GJ744_010280 [Endocarpon pusillum]|uniref:NACHT domain-containing protein n=1 Tax=Endocarpon pusillum TaxID=364733 RepID=A0A8H7E3T3_9EURO|nr:hypothetical protein GJ744_010280 [Endocarpon pusillum]